MRSLFSGAWLDIPSCSYNFCTLAMTAQRQYTNNTIISFHAWRRRIRGQKFKSQFLDNLNPHSWTGKKSLLLSSELDRRLDGEMEVRQVHKIDQSLSPHFFSALSSPAFCLLANDLSAIMKQLDFVTDGTIFLQCIHDIEHMQKPQYF